eukprot:1137613-Pelagomonas_calceolata.AAC.5
MAAPGSGASADLSYSRSCWNVGPWLGASACRAVYCMGQVIDNFGGASGLAMVDARTLLARGPTRVSDHHHDAASTLGKG